MSGIIAGRDPGRPPQSLPGFEHIQRFWDGEHGCWSLKILPGEYYVTCADEAVSTVLGSCVSACVRDPQRRIGGMNHFLLPVEGVPDEAAADPQQWLATRYGTHAMASLLDTLLGLGARRERLEVKVFGGGRILAGMTDVGAGNIAFVRRYLAAAGLRICAEDLGGTQPRKIVYFPLSGRVRLKRLRPVESRIVSHHEQLYLESLREAARREAAARGGAGAQP